MKAFITIFIIGAAIVLMSLQAAPPKETIGVNKAVYQIGAQSKIFAQSTVTLENRIISLNPDDHRSVISAQNALRVCRYNYKSIEYFLEYFFKSSAHVYNSPDKYEVEESELEYEEPIGLQVMETLLYQPINADAKQKLLAQIRAIKTSSQDINSLLYDFRADDKQLLESIRLELIRVMTLGITGYDAPFLKSGITESCYALRSIQRALLPFLKSNSSTAKKSAALLTASISYLNYHPDFDSFNRLKFFTDYALPLQYQLNLLIRENHLELNTTGILNYNADNLFSKNFFKVDSFYKQNAVSNTQIISLGKRLFFEKAISGNGLRSCASCHQPEKYFTDGLSKSVALDGHSIIKRNTPTLLYAAYQYSQDWDGRARSLEDQVINVMNNKDEMNANTLQVIQKMKNNSSYFHQFNEAFRGEQSVTIHNLSVAISAYVRTLAPMNSAFDNYIRGKKNAMTNTQIKGFNLFMGKAKCGTCHFVPLFNGLTPPGYQASEYEILGVPLTDDIKKPKCDQDAGRYDMFPTKYYRGAFKTPTVRNVTQTGPYMHNGGFYSLRKIIEFYNQGGGQGIGLNIPEQTLAADKLKLSQPEINNIIAFLHTLTDHN